MNAAVIFLVAALLGLSHAELFQQCANSRAIPDIDKAVSVATCKKAPCRLRKGTSQDIQIRFTPNKDVKSLVNTVSADIAGLPFPFIGVDGTSACNNIFEADGTTKVACPLKSGTEYLYKNKIDVLDLYPRANKVVVMWANRAGTGNVACFRVPAKITN